MLNFEKYTPRILAVDDEDIILESYQNIFSSDDDDEMFSASGTKAKEIYGEQTDNNHQKKFELVTCKQGDEALNQVKEALREERPYSVAFLDVRMPPGPDGVWVAQEIHALDPSINIVIVTAYTDIPPQVISQTFTKPSHLFYILKPFHWDEIYQFAVALSENWKVSKELHEQYSTMEQELVEQNYTLHTAQKKARDILASKIHLEDEILHKTQQVEEVNTALRVLLRERDRDKSTIEENIMLNIKELVLPDIVKLEKTDLTAHQKLILSQIEQNVKNLTSSFSRKIAARRLSLTPVELQVANLIKHGSTTKDIAEILNLSVLTVESYRKNIRKKMGLTNKKENLRTNLLEYL